MTVLDWALLGVWLGFALAGFWKGAVRIVLGLGGLAAGVWIAVAAGGECAALLAPWLGEGWIVAALGRALPAIACIALCLAAGWGISKTLEALHLGWLNRLAGVLLAGTDITALAVSCVPGRTTCMRGPAISLATDARKGPRRVPGNVTGLSSRFGISNRSSNGKAQSLASGLKN